TFIPWGQAAYIPYIRVTTKKVRGGVTRGADGEVLLSMRNGVDMPKIQERVLRMVASAVYSKTEGMDDYWDEHIRYSRKQNIIYCKVLPHARAGITGAAVSLLAAGLVFIPGAKRSAGFVGVAAYLLRNYAYKYVERIVARFVYPYLLKRGAPFVN